MVKRSCRRTNDENRIHEKAVKMRKMTDEQLVHYVEDRVAKAESEGYNRGAKEVGQHSAGGSEKGVRNFLENFKQVPGIGKITYMRLVEFAKVNGYMSEEEQNEGKNSNG